MQIKFVEIQDILSIGHVRLEFSNSGLILLDGWNHDDGSANGAGKTAVPSAIAFGIYENIPRKISKSEILRRGSKKGYVHVGIQIGEDLLEVKRSRPRNVEYFINGIKSDMTQEEFEKKIRMSYDQFLICMYAAQIGDQRFMSINDTGKKDFILKLMDLNKFLFKKKEIDATIKTLIDNRLEIEKIIGNCESKKSVYVGELVDVEALKEQISALSNSNLAVELKNASVVTKPDYSRFQEVRDKINANLRKLDAIDSKLSMDRMLHNQLQKEIAELESHDFSEDGIECPSCNERFISSQSGMIKIDQLQDQHKEKIKEKKEHLAQTIIAINGAGNTRAKRSEIVDLSVKLNTKIQTKEAEYSAATSRMSDIKTKIAIQQNSVAVLTEKLQKQETYISKIAEIDAILVKAKAKLAKVNVDIELTSTISNILSPTGAPAYIVDSIVDIFNQRVSDYVSLIWPNATYRLQSFKENKDHSVKAKFSDKLVIAGRDVSIGSLSGGEFRCLSISVDFAVIDVVESMFGIRISPVFLDEPFDGLDTSNRERVINLLEKLSSDRQIWIIDHASEAKSMFTDTVRIEKKNGISSIIH